MSKEYVTKEKVIETILSYGIGWGSARVRGVINNIPAADVEEVRHGYWTNERWEGLSSFSAECSECTKRTLSYFHYNYCPNCGAKMDKGINE